MRKDFDVRYCPAFGIKFACSTPSRRMFVIYGFWNGTDTARVYKR